MAKIGFKNNMCPYNPLEKQKLDSKTIGIPRDFDHDDKKQYEFLYGGSHVLLHRLHTGSSRNLLSSGEPIPCPPVTHRHLEIVCFGKQWLVLFFLLQQNQVCLANSCGLGFFFFSQSAGIMSQCLLDNCCFLFHF